MDLVQVVNDQVVVSSRQVAESFGKQHKHILDSIENMKAENSALIDMFSETEYKVDNNRRTYKEYLMNRDGFSLLVMGFTGKKALEWKLKYIEAFNKMEKQLKTSTLLPDFSNPAIAARAWADQYEKRELAEKEVKELKPKAEYYETVSDNKNSFSFRVTAKMIGYPEKQMIKYLLEYKYLYRDDNGILLPYQRFSTNNGNGMFTVKEVTIGKYKDGDGIWHNKTAFQTLVTPFGRQKLIQLCKKWFTKTA